MYQQAVAFLPFIPILKFIIEIGTSRQGINALFMNSRNARD